MEYKQYYMKRPDGTFFVHFPNFHGLTESEIFLQFAEYGNVVSVDTRGQVTGLCFVTYKNEEDVIRCLEGFKHNKSIRILKHKTQNKSKDQKDPKQKQESNTEGSEDATKKEHLGHQESTKSSSEGKNKGHNLKIKQESDMYGSLKSLNQFHQHFSSSSSEKGYKMNNSETKEHSDIPKAMQSLYQIAQDKMKLNSKSENKEFDPKSESKFPGNVKPDFKSKKKVVESKTKPLSPGNMKSDFKSTKKVGEIKTKPLPPGNVESDVKPKKKVNPKMNKGVPPPLMSLDTGAILKKDVEKGQSPAKTNPGSKTNSIFEDPDIYDNIFEDEASDFGISYPPCLLPNLTMQNIKGIGSCPSPSIKSIRSINTQIKIDSNIRLAQEVIVANIDAAYGIHYILHLFEKFNPIAASMIKTTTNSKIRYCHIYVTSWKEALAIQQKFDGYSLDEKNLIVLTSQNLIREALAA